MRRLLELVLAATVAALVAMGIKRLLEPGPEVEAIPAPSGRNGRPASTPAKSGSPTRDELYSEAQRLDIQGRSKMNKKELAEAVETAKTGERV